MELEGDGYTVRRGVFSADEVAAPTAPRANHGPCSRDVALRGGRPHPAAGLPGGVRPTAVVPGSHRSGRLPPRHQASGPALTYDGRPPVLSEAAAVGPHDPYFCDR